MNTMRMTRMWNMTSTLMYAFFLNLLAVASSVLVAGQVGGSPTLSGETLIPLAVVAVLVIFAVNATRRVGKFIDRVDHLSDRLEDIEKHLSLSPRQHGTRKKS